MKVAVLHPQCQIPGGAIKMMLLANKVLSENGHETTFFTFSQSSECFLGLQENVQVVRGMGRLFRLSLKLRGYDLIICGNPPMHAAAALSKLLGAQKKIVWWHHHIPWYSKENSKFKIQNSKLPLFAKRFVEKIFIIPRIDEHWATSQYVADCLMDYAGKEASVLYPILEEAYLSHQKEPSTSSLQPPTKRHVMVTHGRMVAGKGFSTLFSVYENLKKVHQDLQFWVVGEGEMRQELEKVYGDDNSVTFFGQVSTDKIIELYGQADIAVFGSRIDAFGMSVLESQALGVDTVVLNIGGAKEAVVDPDVGHIVADQKAMEAEIDNLLGLKRKKSNTQSSTHTYVYEPFSLSFFTQVLLSLISK